MMNNAVSISSYREVFEGFQSPQAGCGPVPFYWWTGDRLDRDRLAWQLDRLAAGGIRQTIISYPHLADNGTDLGDPPLFSAEWWDLLRWFLGACRERGMTTGFQDYTIIQPLLKQIGHETPDMQGGQMSSVSRRVKGSFELVIRAEHESLPIGAWAYPVEKDIVQGEQGVELAVNNDQCAWVVPEGEWLVVMVFARLVDFDPLHPESGLRLIEKLYAPFERECSGELGKTFKVFFQDELDFGGRMPFWSNRLREVFLDRHGYDLWPWLAALWHDLGPRTKKIRLDFSDAVVAAMEKNYFEPVYRWHEARGILFGNDNCGRGRMRIGREHYGDYFRTMRWYMAPGNDDPKLQGPRAFKGLKVNSSIAHLYGRPRVWNEVFHSSGWGASPATVLAALNEDFAYGATMINPHGLYYSTHGGWWEWASPDFHFRQPYWEHAATMNLYINRLSWLLSRGTHCCDVAILYPSAAFDGETADERESTIVAHVGNEAIAGGSGPDAEADAFGLARYLTDRACDVDFIDFESVARSEVCGGLLKIAGESYRVLILPSMDTIRLSTMEKARDFARAGGCVIDYGRLPTACEDEDDSQLSGLVQELFGKTPQSSCGCRFIVTGYESVFSHINASIARDVTVDVVPLHVLHRRVDGIDVYYVFNPSTNAVDADVCFRALGRASRWDAWTGSSVELLSKDHDVDTTTVRLCMEPRDAQVIVFTGEGPGEGAKKSMPGISERVLQEWSDAWSVLPHPTLDNRHGDFRLPATMPFIGPEVRRFRYADETQAGLEWARADFDDSAWPETTYSFGPRLWMLGPIAPGVDLSKIEAELVGLEVVDPDVPVTVQGRSYQWRPYSMSLRWGIERDPFLTDWLSGPHGLKGNVPDDFIDLYDEQTGSVWYVWSAVKATQAGAYNLRIGSRSAWRAWFQGKPVLEQVKALSPGRYPPWNIPHYEAPLKTASVTLTEGDQPLLMRFEQSLGQRVRGHFAFDTGSLATKSTVPALRWFEDPKAPRPCCGLKSTVRWFRFHAPPGLVGLRCTVLGSLRAWIGGADAEVDVLGVESNGLRWVRIRAASIQAESSVVALRVEVPADSRAGDALPEPIECECGPGLMPAGDWCAHGLASYSGAMEYRRTVCFEEGDIDESIWVDMGHVSASVEVRVNGHSAGTLVAPPWRVRIGALLKPGDNELVLTVANTLANHYAVGIPTPYAFPEQTVSGLIGPVRLINRR